MNDALRELRRRDEPHARGLADGSRPARAGATYAFKLRAAEEVGSG